MKQTHKFQALGDVAEIVAKASSVAAAAKQLGVERSTIHRWIEKGKVPRPGGAASIPDVAAAVVSQARSQSPEEWAAGVRSAFSLTDTELMLLDLAERALTLARDSEARSEARLGAMTRFQQLVKQLNLQPAPSVATGKPDAPSRAVATSARRVAGDPRAFLMAVK